jgi:hypothetical protein
MRGKLGADVTLNDAPKPIRVEVGPGSGVCPEFRDGRCIFEIRY